MQTDNSEQKLNVFKWPECPFLTKTEPEVFTAIPHTETNKQVTQLHTFKVAS